MTVIPWQARETGARRVPRRGLLAAARMALRDRRRRARDRRELAALDDRTLHDLGLSRGDVHYLSSKAGERHRRIDDLRFPPF